MRFTVGFEAGIRQGTSANFVLKDDGSLGVLSTDYPDSIPVTITHSAEYKIYDDEEENIKDVSVVSDIKNDGIADDPAYLLDKNGYMLYKFQPKYNNEYVFGNYTFSTETFTQLPPSIRIYLLKKMSGGQALSLDVYSGKGGNGGRGGNGGKGGNGGNGKDGNIFGGQTAGGDGGNGGNGGTGGSYGTGIEAFNSYDIHKVVNYTDHDFTEMFNRYSDNGYDGAGGIGGKGGSGGSGGKNTWGSRAASGANGVNGSDGGRGGSPY